MSPLRPRVVELIHHFLPADGLIVATRDAAESKPRAQFGRFQPMSLDVKTLGLHTPDYLPEVHYHQVRDAWHGLRTPSGK